MPGAQAALLEAVLARFGRLDVLVNNAGITHAADADAEVTPTLDPQPGYCCVVFTPSDQERGMRAQGD